MGGFFEEGLKAYHEGRYEDAGELFQQYIEEDDQNPKVWNALGICLSKLEQNDDAIICFENALILDPENQIYKKNLDKQKKKKTKNIPETISKFKKFQLSNRPIIHYIGFIGVAIVLLILLSVLSSTLSDSKPVQDINLQITPIITPSIIITSTPTSIPTTILPTPTIEQTPVKKTSNIPSDMAFYEIYVVSKSMADKKDYDERYYKSISDLSKALSYYLKNAQPYLDDNGNSSNYQYNRLKTDLLVVVNKYSSERDFIDPPVSYRDFEEKVYSLSVNISGAEQLVDQEYSIEDLLTDPVFLNIHNTYNGYSQDQINNLISSTNTDKELNAYLDELKKQREEADQKWVEEAQQQRKQNEIKEQQKQQEKQAKEQAKKACIQPCSDSMEICRQQCESRHSKDWDKKQVCIETCIQISNNCVRQCK